MTHVEHARLDIPVSIFLRLVVIFQLGPFVYCGYDLVVGGPVFLRVRPVSVREVSGADSDKETQQVVVCTHKNHYYISTQFLEGAFLHNSSSLVISFNSNQK